MVPESILIILLVWGYGCNNQMDKGLVPTGHYTSINIPDCTSHPGCLIGEEEIIAMEQ